MEKKREAPLKNVRIIGIFAHVDAGKTTTSESILYYTGRIHRAGSIDDGDTQMDFLQQERERGITIMSAATACHWHGHRINLIDTPGHIDFTAEVVRSIRVIDGAVMIVCGVGGVEPQTEAVWLHANREKLARLIFVNKLDRVGADFYRVLDEIRERLTPNAVPVELPIGIESDFVGVVDLFSEQALVWRDGNDDPDPVPVPADMVASVDKAREALFDAICETDDVLLEQRLEGLPVDMETLRTALRKAVIAGQIVPVLCGASRNRIAVQPLLDAIVDYLPAPVDMPPVLGHDPAHDDEIIERQDAFDVPFCASAFKIVTDPHVGHLTWVRVFSGQMNAGELIYNPRIGQSERVGRIYRMHANHREQVESMAAGDVVALVGIKSAVTGDTLCDPAHPIVLEGIHFPTPVIAVALTPPSSKEREKLHQAVTHLCDEDPTLIQNFDAETGELTLAGMGELHLDVSVDRLRTEFGIVPQVSAPQVSYRETVQKRTEVTTTYKKQSGGHGHYAEIVLGIEPLAEGEEADEQGIGFVHAAPPAELPRDFWRPTELGVRRALQQGVIAGYPVVGVKVTLLDGRYHEVDSAAIDFEVVGGIAARQVVHAAAPALLEPIMHIDINVAEEYVGAIVADIGRRRGVVHAVRVRGLLRNVDGEVPLAEARGYATALRSMTQGRGTFTLEFKRYAVVPEGIAATVIKERQAAGKVPLR
ncbi:MAG TPA: elongation factor G [Anaerolineae bacterium]|nr:elongation factor G [Anaerolineae bacterium]HQH37402.1 elongation factor G [Anaerolineae bacterium]